MSEEVRGVDEDEFRLATTAWPSTYGDAARPRVGFFTDTSVCIGCKACEVACKEWNEVPEDGLAVERRLVSACAGVFAPLTAGMGLAGFTRS